MAHRACQPLLPTGNKYLQQKWDEAAYDLHRGKVKSAKPTINTTPPKTYSHLTAKLKNLKLEEERAMKMRRENNMLAEKIAHITRIGGGVDNRNYYDGKRSVEWKRQLELLRITKENQKILFRLGQCRSHYNRRSWHEGWLQTLKVMDSIAHYPRGRTKGQRRSNRTQSCKTQGRVQGRVWGKGKDERNQQERR
uniref:CFAP97 domain containing 2 n=1 Tax=Cyclopterus lumpus TaxID=8103 RepID=A0A8C3A5J9_CYCLU